MFGVFASFGIIAHYCVGARWPTGPVFLQNITLWYACPWTLSVASLQAGGFGMVAMGLARLLAARFSSDASQNTSGIVALWSCVVGLIGVFLAGYPGYFFFDAIWPSFYYSPIPAGKNAWLLSQAFFIAVYLLGAVLMFGEIRRALNAIPATAS
jgi:hypothetical protein